MIWVLAITFPLTAFSQVNFPWQKIGKKEVTSILQYFSCGYGYITYWIWSSRFHHNQMTSWLKIFIYFFICKVFWICLLIWNKGCQIYNYWWNHGRKQQCFCVKQRHTFTLAIYYMAYIYDIVRHFEQFLNTLYCTCWYISPLFMATQYF